MSDREKQPLLDRCQLEIVIGSDGKPHIEGECLDKESRDELASAFDEEAILRVKPKVAKETEVVT